MAVPTATPTARNATRFGPRFTLHTAGIRFAGYDERHADLLNLSVDSTESNQTLAALGIVAQLDRQWLSRAARIDVSAAWQHAFGDTEVTSFSSLVNVDSFFENTSAHIDHDRLVLGLGVSLALGRQISAQIRYDGSFVSDYSDHRGSIGLSARF